VNGIQKGQVGEVGELARQIRKREAQSWRKREPSDLPHSASETSAKFVAVIDLVHTSVANGPILFFKRQNANKAASAHIEKVKLDLKRARHNRNE
jgi:hypothetical protein